ncbi:MAG: CBASS cGAMP-activated phospholipase [Balneolaceae bacterium]
MLYNSDKSFKILSIDGGGVRGIYPAKILAELESELVNQNKRVTNLNNYFDLICGTSTGGIIALGLALGMKADQIFNLYKNHSADIFGSPRNLIERLFRPKYSQKELRRLINREFTKSAGINDPKIGHCKTRICIPVYNAGEGQVNIIKTSHHPELYRDLNYPAVDVAQSTAAAPTFFKPHSFSYKVNKNDKVERRINNIDAGVFANNPTFIGLIEATRTLDVPLEKVKILSLGTGSTKFIEKETDKNFGMYYWMKPKKLRMVNLFFSSQANDVENVIKFFHQGVGSKDQEEFYYRRLQYEFKSGQAIDLDESNPLKLSKMIAQAISDFKESGQELVKEFCEQPITPFQPHHNL